MVVVTSHLNVHDTALLIWYSDLLSDRKKYNFKTERAEYKHVCLFKDLYHCGVIKIRKHLFVISRERRYFESTNQKAWNEGQEKQISRTMTVYSIVFNEM